MTKLLKHCLNRRSHCQSRWECKKFLMIHSHKMFAYAVCSCVNELLIILRSYQTQVQPFKNHSHILYQAFSTTKSLNDNRDMNTNFKYKYIGFQVVQVVVVVKWSAWSPSTPTILVRTRQESTFSCRNIIAFKRTKLKHKKTIKVLNVKVSNYNQNSFLHFSSFPSIDRVNNYFWSGKFDAAQARIAPRGLQLSLG